MDSNWIDAALDRVHELAEQGYVDEAELLYKEIKQFVTQEKTEEIYLNV
jgi:hypothetical protein